MSKEPLQPEGRAGSTDEDRLSRRGFFKFFGRSVDQNEADIQKGEGERKMVKLPLIKKTISRRKLIAYLVALPPAYYLSKKLVSDYGVDVLNFANDIVAEDEYDSEVERSRDYLEERYNCKILFSLESKVPLESKKEALRKLKAALSKYPPEMIRSEGIKWQFGRFLNDHNGFLSGNACIHNAINISTFFSGDIEKTMHHEIGHVLTWTYDSKTREYASENARDQIDPDLDDELIGWTGNLSDIDDGDYTVEGACAEFPRKSACRELEQAHEKWEKLSISKRKKASESDKKIDSHMRESFISAARQWVDLNPEGNSVYVGRDSSFPTYLQYGLGREKEFIDYYGQSNGEEDQARCGETLLADIPYITDTLVPLCETEEGCVIMNKIKEMMRRYYKLSGGKMDDQYWRDLRAGNVNEDYWIAKKAGPLNSIKEKIPSVFL